MTLRAYIINVGPHGAPRITFGCMSANAKTAKEQHLCLREGDEEVEAIPLRDESLPVKLVRHELQTGQMRGVIRG